MQILEAMNQLVNSAIFPYPFLQTALPNERWLVMPYYGNCHDYAITKRHQLLKMGWPSSALLLAEVKMESGEHHLVLVVEVEGRRFVLDNLSSQVTPIELRKEYTWLRISSPKNPTYWIDARAPDR
jgi:predicted transglutaminase-like cysteine proteinase